MADDVLITPASRKVEFFDSGGNIDGKIELDGSGNLNITSTGNIAVGDITEDIHVGDGTQAVDLVFDFTSSIYSVANQDLTIGKKSLGGNDITIDTPSYLNITTDSGYVRVGPQNTSWAHIVTDIAKFYMNKPLVLSGGNTSGDAYNLSSYSDQDLVLATQSGSENRITIKSDDGHVGIGTTDPATNLHIADTGTTHITPLRLDNGIDTDGGRGVGMDFRVRFSSTNIHTSEIYFDFYGDKWTDSIGMNYVSGRSGAFSHHYFREQGGGVQMMIADDGQVGIGSSFTHAAQPDDLLHLKGSDGGTALLVQDTGSNSNPAVEIKNDAVHWKLQARGGTSDNFQIGEGTNTHVVVDTSGNVGINKTDPAYPLDVNGKIHANDGIRSGSRASFNTMTYYYYDRQSMGTSAVYLRAVVGGSSTANPSNYYMPHAGQVMQVMMGFYGQTLATSGTDTWTIHKIDTSGSIASVDFDINFANLNRIGTTNNYNILIDVTVLSDASNLNFVAGDQLQIQRTDSSPIDIEHANAQLWVTFNI